MWLPEALFFCTSENDAQKCRESCSVNMMRYFDFFGDYFCPSNLDSLLSLFLLIGIELVDFFF